MTIRSRRSALGTAAIAAAIAAMLAVVPVATSAAQSRDATPPLVVSTAWLAEHLQDRDLVVVEIAMEADRTRRVPGTRAIAYDRFTARRGTLSTELPDAAALRATFATLGITDASHVVVYAHQAPMATRALFSLAFLGHTKLSYLDGGLEKWHAENRPTGEAVTAAEGGAMSERPTASVVADAAWMQANTGAAGVSFIDTRTTGEYNGTGNRSGMPSAGHIAGAKQLEWEDLFADRSVTLKPRAELEKLFAERVAPGDKVATYCWIGYRASATWFVARYLGYDARLYDGSYQDWSQRNLPTRAGTAP